MNELRDALTRYEADEGLLPGLRQADWKQTFIDQMISSLRRIEFVRVVCARPISHQRLDPFSSAFDPIRGAAFLGRHGAYDEAVWMTFIATQFGKHAQDNWMLAANIYGSFGLGPVWTAEAYGNDPIGFNSMLRANEQCLRDKSCSGRYSNHRQYESKSPNHLSSVFMSFHNWQFSDGGFPAKVRVAHAARGQSPTEAFDELYKSVKRVAGFGRLAAFDFTTMIGKLQLAPIEPGSVYLSGATGPLRGAKLLFFGDADHPITAKELEHRVDRLDDYLGIGKQPLEDSLCNWQKQPSHFKYFRG